MFYLFACVVFVISMPIRPEGLSQRRRLEQICVRQQPQSHVCNVAQVSPNHRLGRHRATEEYPVAAAWHRFVWSATQGEVLARFGTDHRVHISHQKGAPEVNYSMAELHARIFQGSQESSSAERWRSEVNAMHDAVHCKLGESSQCPVCTGVRLWKDNRWLNVDWNPKALSLLWGAIESTVRQHGIGWSAWRPCRSKDAPSVRPRLPAKLQLENIPRDAVQELPGGVFKWGSWTTGPDVESAEAGWSILNQQWQEHRKIRINLLLEMDEQTDKRSQNQPGDKLVLRRGDQGQCFTGRVWRFDEEWSFQEENTGIQVTVEVNQDLGIVRRHQQCEERLYRAMKAEHVKRKQAAAKATRKEATKADVPRTTSDMIVKGKTSEGKLLYAWGSLERGRVEVQVTPRAMRVPAPEESSEFKRTAARETTPERALRKMTTKVRKLHAKASRGQQERIVARAAPGGETPERQSACVEESAYAPALRTLSDPQALGYVIETFEFLSSLRLHYCCNCDEEWPVFDAEWPQTGVPWVGPKAGRCETIHVRHGFWASSKDATRCGRCDGPTAYRQMYCAENLQHLGLRRPALSAATWYESLLIARVHPVMSVITLTATGLLCYAGHVCNYYVKVMEWIRGLPAVLRDKKWFLIKRRRSIRAGYTDTRQKKPTTANRHRLEAAMREAMQYMPTVYEGSVSLPEELNKFPRDGEQEMLEQEESVDLGSEVHLSQEVFEVWFNSGAASAAQKPCAAIIHRYAVDQQGLDYRGSVSADTAWELCCRLLSLAPQQNKIGTRDVAQLLVYWLAECQVPSQMGEAVYKGMSEHWRQNNKRAETEEDDQLLKCRWVRWLIHAELDAVREECAARGEDLAVDLEVERCVPVCRLP